MKIVVTEYPKSGGTWLVNLIGSATGFARRDIYVRDERFPLLDIRRHPWYEHSEFEIGDRCVIKSHELPGSQLIEFDANYIHLLRDGRDVVVSKYFYESDFLVKNRIREGFDVPFDEYVEVTAGEWAAYVMAWEQEGIHTCRYEDLLAQTSKVLNGIFDYLQLQMSPEAIARSIEENSFNNMRRSFNKLVRFNTFFRKGTAGDWKNHFTEANKRTFKRVAGDALIKLGYETDDHDW